VTDSVRGERNSHRSRRQFAEILLVQWKLALREPYALGGGLALPIALLVVFGFISQSVAGNVAGTGLTVIDLWTPTVLVISFTVLSISLPSTMVRDREIGWLRRVSTTPVHPSRLLGAQLVINLVIAVAAVLIITVGGALVFGASLHVSILPFGVSLVLSIAELFTLGLMIVALAPSQVVGQAIGGVVTFALFFLAGLWVNPAQAGEPLATIMHYSPSGAASRALLDAVFNSSPSFAAWATMAVYTVVFTYVAIRYFRWE
jgi:ABC-2 type transport system permease protein